MKLEWNERNLNEALWENYFYYLERRCKLVGFEVVKATTLKVAVVEALTSLGGSGTVLDVSRYVNSKYPNKWKLNTIGTIMADLCPESTSSSYSKKDRVLERIGRDKYRLRKSMAFPISRTVQTKRIRDYAESVSLEVYSFRGLKRFYMGKVSFRLF